MNDSRIKLIRPCQWEEVFINWYEDEGKNPEWLALAKERGFASWADWRLNGYARRFECEKAKWGLYEIENPGEIVSGWFGGPFRTWIERYYGGEKTKMFGELAQHPDVLENPRVKSMIGDYPKDTIITAMRLSDGRIFVIEGSHRSCALAALAKSGKNMPSKLIVAIGESQLSELPAVGQNTADKTE